VFKKVLVGLLLMFVAGAANAAFFGTGKFKVTAVTVSNPGNFPLRITGFTSATMSPTPLPTCATGGYGFAYLDDSDPDFNNKFVAMMMAYKSGKFVSITFDDSNANACHIVEFSIWDTYP